MTTRTHADTVAELDRNRTANRVVEYRHILGLAKRERDRGNADMARQLDRQAAEYYATRLGDRGRRIVGGDNGDLCDYGDGDVIRRASAAERDASEDAAERDGGAGVIDVDGRRCFVQD